MFQYFHILLYKHNTTQINLITIIIIKKKFVKKNYIHTKYKQRNSKLINKLIIMINNDKLIQTRQI